MKIRTKIIIGFLIIIIPTLILGYFSVNQIDKITEPLSKDIPQSVDSVSKTSYLDSLAQFIRYYDEVLTQSARNYAFTQDKKWKNIYFETVLKLDDKIKQALDQGYAEDRVLFNSVDQANIALIEMEEKAIALVDNDEAEEAVVILESDEYWRQKEIYKTGLVKYVEIRGLDYDDALSASTLVLELATQDTQEKISQSRKLILILIIGALLLAIVIGIFVSYYITRPIAKLAGAVDKITKGELETRAEIYSKDEVGQLASSFNQMSDKIKKFRSNIEKQVADRTADLEKVNKSMIGRELKMVELKKEIQELKNKLEIDN